MKKFKKLDGVAVKAKYFGKEIDCVISIDEDYLFLCHDTMPDGLDEAYYERAKILTKYETTYKTTYKSGLSQDWELIDDELGIYVFGKEEKINFNVEEANFIEADCATTFIAPKLKKVYGALSLGFEKDAITISCPNIEYIGGSVDIKSTEAIAFPKLKTLKGSLNAEYASALIAPVLEVVKGNIIVKAAERINMPKLKTISDFLAINAKTIYFPSLKAANRFFANTATEVRAQKLETVSDFKARVAHTVDLSNLKIAERIFVNSKTNLNMPKLKKGETFRKKE